MLIYLATQDESKCCGCRACSEICPKKAISMKANQEGFSYPVLDEEKCVDCKLCEKVCPEMVEPVKAEPVEIYAVQNKNEEELFDSSSGGAFRLVADCVIQQGGYVIGCVWNEKMEPVLMVTDTMDGLKPMQGSKYLSSSTVHTYSQTKVLLDKGGKTVLFTGTPCQCAGLLNYLRKPYENLLTMDFLCHGVPSQTAFSAYKDSCEKKHSDGKMNQYKCRDKSAHGWAISESYFIQKKKFKAHGMTSPYLFGYISGYFNRYSCYSCKFRGKERFTDYTICDYWGYHQELDSHKGISAFQVNTLKGKEFMDLFAENAWMHLAKREDVAIENPAILKSHEETVPELRKMIYQQIRTSGWAVIEKKYLRCKHFYLKKLWYSLPDQVTIKLRKLLHWNQRGDKGNGEDQNTSGMC